MAHPTEDRTPFPAYPPPLSLVVAPDRTPTAKEWRRYDRMLGPAGHRALDSVKLAAGERALDLGAGAGGLTLEAAHRVGPAGASAGIDPDAAAIGVARTRAREQRLSWATFGVGDIERVELPGWAFDAVISRFGISAMADPVAGFTRIARVLVPGGRLSFVCWQTAEQNAWHALPRRVLSAGFGAELARWVSDSARGSRPFALADREQLANWLERTGFVDVNIESIESPVWVGDDVDDALEFFFETDGRPLDERFDQKRFERLTRDLRAELAGFVRPDGVWVPAAAWLVTACSARSLLAG